MQAFNLRLVAEDVSDRLTGFLHNAVTPVGLAQRVPIILSHRSCLLLTVANGQYCQEGVCTSTDLQQ